MRNKKNRLTHLSLFSLCLLFSPGAYAQLEPLENITTFFVDFLTGDFARSVAIIAVAVLGYLGLSGRLRWVIAGSVIVGIALIFGSAVIVDAVQGSV
ncbi:MAG: TrbC/VirB2 family protein [Pseudomonadota bacterium]